MDGIQLQIIKTHVTHMLSFKQLLYQWSAGTWFICLTGKF